MTLPKLDQPTYELVLPSTKERIKYRPFLVKEEKILLMANEGGDSSEQVEAVKQIVRNCIISGTLNVEKLSTFDLEYLFIKIRSKSVGNEISLNYKREGCTAELEGAKDTIPRTCQIPFKLDLDDVTIENVEGHTNNIKLTDTVGVVMKYPDFKLLEQIQTMETYDEILDVIIGCVETIYMGEETYDPTEYSIEEMRNFIEELSQDQFQHISEFFETMPATATNVNVVCSKCGWKTNIKLKGISDFFV
jgi:hypothetical protein